MRSARLAALLALVACGAPPEDADAARPVDGGRDAPAARDAGEDAFVAVEDAGACAPSLDSPDWLEEYERNVVGTLSGEREVEPGIRITERGTQTGRDRARAWIRAALEAQGLPTSLHDYGTGANVVAELAATTDPGSSRVVLGAHFDGVTIGPAAADNATGVALVLAAARWIASSFPCRSRDLVFVLFDQEEIGLVGSNAFAGRLEADGVPVLAVHSFDMLSWDMDGDRRIEMWLPSADIRTAWEEAAAAHGARTSVESFASSDHAAFFERRIPTVGLCEEFVGGDRTPYYHTPDDSYDKVDFAFLGMATEIAVDVVARQLAPE